VPCCVVEYLRIGADPEAVRAQVVHRMLNQRGGKGLLVAYWWGRAVSMAS
jgi:hypothetical protein